MKHGLDEIINSKHFFEIIYEMNLKTISMQLNENIYKIDLKRFSEAKEGNHL